MKNISQNGCLCQKSLIKGLAAGVTVAGLLFSGSAFATNIGQVRVSEGNVTIVRGAANIPAAVGTAVEVGDVVQTGQGRVSVTMIDGTKTIVGPNSKVSLDKYEFNPDNQKGGMLVSVLGGMMRMVSGLITKSNPGQALIKTGTATCGLRGTDIIVDVPVSQ